MSGEKELPKTAESVTKEAVKDAADIKDAGSPEAAYKKFREELTNMETAGFSGAQRLDYQQQLKSALGNDVDKVIVGYLSSNESAMLKDSSTGYVNREAVNNARAQQSRYGTDADLALPILIIENFSRIGGSNMDMDSDKYITTEDLKKANAGFEDQSQKAASIKSIKDNNIANALLNPQMDRFFDTLDTRNQWSSTTDNVVSKTDLDKFLADNQNPKPAEKDAIDALKYIQSHWDDDIGHQLRGWNSNSHQYKGRFSKDSIAQASGYTSADDFRTKNFNDDGSKKVQDRVVATEKEITYENYGRKFQVNKDNEIVSYTDKFGDKSIDYDVDKEGTVRNRRTQEIAGYNAKLAADGTFTFNDNTEARTPHTDAPKAAVEPTQTEASKLVTYRTEDTTRVLTLDPETKKVTTFTEASNANPEDKKTYKVDENGVATNVAKADDVKNVKYDVAKNELIINDKKQEQNVEPRTEAAQVVTFKTADKTRTLTIDPNTKEVTQFTEASNANPEQISTYKRDAAGNYENTKNSTDKQTVLYDAEKKELTVNGFKQTEIVEKEKPNKEVKSTTLKYDNNIERTLETDTATGKLIGYTEKQGDKVSTYSVDPDSCIVTDISDKNAPKVLKSHAAVDKDGVFASDATGKVVKEKPVVDSDKAVKPTDISSKSFLENSTQHSGQGYWQVAESMLQNGDKKAIVSPTENTILMRALQSMHKSQGGRLGNHKFVSKQSELQDLQSAIKAYTDGRPAFKTAAPALIEKLSQMAQSPTA